LKLELAGPTENSDEMSVASDEPSLVGHGSVFKMNGLSWLIILKKI
jgi:hypothetical protein